jgi:hypothetical protein
MDQMISALGMELIPNVPGDPVTMNRLLLKNIEMQKLMIAALDVGIDWDTYQIWVEPGELRTKIVPVQNGDVVVVKVINWDQDNAEPIYYGQNPLVLPPTNEGLLFPQTSIQAPAIFFDFNEAGPNFAGVITVGVYTTGPALAAQIQAAMAAFVTVNTYQVRWLDGPKLFEIEATNAGAVPFNITPFSGPNAANSIGPQIGWTIDTAGVGTPLRARSNSVLVANVKREDHILTGHPLLAGDTDTLVLEQDLWAVLRRTYAYRVPLSIRRSRIVTRNRF